MNRCISSKSYKLLLISFLSMLPHFSFCPPKTEHSQRGLAVETLEAGAAQVPLGCVTLPQKPKSKAAARSFTSGATAGAACSSAAAAAAAAVTVDDDQRVQPGEGDVNSEKAAEPAQASAAQAESGAGLFGYFTSFLKGSAVTAPVEPAGKAPEIKSEHSIIQKVALQLAYMKTLSVNNRKVLLKTIEDQEKEQGHANTYMGFLFQQPGAAGAIDRSLQADIVALQQAELDILKTYVVLSMAKCEALQKTKQAGIDVVKAQARNNGLEATTRNNFAEVRTERDLFAEKIRQLDSLVKALESTSLVVKKA